LVLQKLRLVWHQMMSYYNALLMFAVNNICVLVELETYHEG